MIVKVIQKNRIGGYRLEPDTIMDLPNAIANEALALGCVESLGENKHVNLGGTRLNINDELGGHGDVLIRNEDD